MKKSFVNYQEPETRFEEKQKERINTAWINCVDFFTDWLTQQDLINSFGEIAIKNGEVKQEHLNDYLETHFREEVRNNYYNYSQFCNYAFKVWTLVKIELKNVSPEERKKFTERIRKLRILSEDYDEILEIFDKLNEYVGLYMPIRPIQLDRELSL